MTNGNQYALTHYPQCIAQPYVDYVNAGVNGCMQHAHSSLIPRQLSDRIIGTMYHLLKTDTQSDIHNGVALLQVKTLELECHPCHSSFR